MLTPVPGLTLAGKYRIVRALGEGGMGAVFEAEHVLSLKRAAIKWLHPRVRERERAQTRLLQEARATARIRHRNVVQLYDVMVEEGAIFLVMELLQGELLSQRVAREPLHLFQLVRLLLPAMEGVMAAHDAGVIHRDIKPENIYLTRAPGESDPTPKIIDFGISKTFDDRAGNATRSGMALGTPRYAAYEQLRNARDIDGRVDVYAFGVILYEALAGRAPYTASTFAEQAVHFVTTAPPPPRLLRPTVPEALDTLVMRAIARDRDQRTATVAELAAALRPFAEPASYAFPLPVLRKGEHPLPEGGAARSVSTQPYAELAIAASDQPASGAIAPASSSLPPAPQPRRRSALARGLLASLLLSVTALALRSSGRESDVTVTARAPAQPLLATPTELAERAPLGSQPYDDDASPRVDASIEAPQAALPAEPTQAREHRRRLPRAAREQGVERAMPVLTDAPAVPPPLAPTEGSPPREPASEIVGSPARAGRVQRDEF